MVPLLTLAVILVAGNPVHGYTRCLECEDMPHPQDCDLITICTPYEICYTEQVVTSGGLIKYNSGCLSKDRCAALQGKRDVDATSQHLAEKRQQRSLHKRQDTVSSTDIATCVECCDGEFCNTQGCGETSVPKAQRGPTCFLCPDAEDPESCRHVTQCYQGQVCVLRKRDITKNLWTTGCIGERQCNTLVHVEELQEAQLHHGHVLMGKRETVEVNHCPRCCTGDFCNHSCKQNFTFNVDTTTVVVPTHPPTTTHKPTTHAPHTHRTHPPTTTTPKPTTHVPHTHRTHPPTTTTPKPTTHAPHTHRTHPPTTTTPKPTTHAPRTHPPTTTKKPTTTHKPTTTTHKPTTTTHKPTTTPAPTTTIPTTIPTTTDPKVECESDHYNWYPQYRLCLKFYTHAKNWTDARDDCEAKHGILVVKGTGEQKMKDVLTLYDQKHYTTQMWVGATSHGSTTVYEWGDGQRERIDPSKGQDLSNSDCVYLISGSFRNSDKCNVEHGYVCERLQSTRNVRYV